MPDDIYPLGQDRGLIPDIINFGLNSLYQHFTPPPPSGSIGGEMRAQDILEKAGSVMARPQLPEWRRDSPLLNTAMGMVDKALSFEPWNQILNINPKQEIDPMAAMTNIGGAENAIFGPIRTRGQKQAVSALWRHSPGDVMAIEADPRTLTVTAPKGNVVAKAQQAEESGWMPEGSAAAYDPRSKEMRVAPATMIGGHYKAPLDQQLSELSKSLGLELPESWTRGRIETGAGGTGAPGLPTGGTTILPESLGHEAQHFLNRPKLYKQSDEEVADIFLKLSPYVSQHGRQAALEGADRDKNMGVALDEMLAYLSGKSTREPANEDVGRIINQLLKTHPGPEGNMGANITPKSVDAAINFAKRIASPNRDIREAAMSQWDQLAAHGKMPVREGEYTGAQKAYKDNPLFSMRQRTEPASMYDKLPRAGRTFTSAEDLARAKAGEELPALGSAMPDIPRPVSSPGGLDFFENLRAKLGLEPADLGGAAPEFYGKKTPPSSLLESKRGGQALNELFQNWAERDRLMRPDKSPLGPGDRFMDEVLARLVIATNKVPGGLRGATGVPQGISGFRRALAPVEYKSLPVEGQVGKFRDQPLDPQKSLDILEQLKEHGFMEPENLQKSIHKDKNAIWQPKVNEEGLAFIKKLLERLGR